LKIRVEYKKSKFKVKLTLGKQKKASFLFQNVKFYKIILNENLSLRNTTSLRAEEK
jgi:hypothetical protein